MNAWQAIRAQAPVWTRKGIVFGQAQYYAISGITPNLALGEMEL